MSERKNKNKVTHVQKENQMSPDRLMDHVGWNSRLPLRVNIAQLLRAQFERRVPGFESSLC